MSMAAKKQPVPQEEDQLVPFNFRIPKSLVDRLDVWVEEQNQGRSWPKLTRSALIRGVLDWAERERPDWEGK